MTPYAFFPMTFTSSSIMQFVNFDETITEFSYAKQLLSSELNTWALIMEVLYNLESLTSDSKKKKSQTKKPPFGCFSILSSTLIFQENRCPNF